MPKRKPDHHRRDRLERVLRLMPKVVAHLEAGGRPRLDLEPGALRLLRPGEMLLLDRGLFRLLPPGGDARTEVAPCMAGLLEAAVGDPVAVEVEALEASSGFLFADGEFYELAKDELLIRKLRYALYEYELARLTDESRSYRKSLHEFYAPSSASLLPGPYEADDVDMVGVLLRSKDPCWTRRMLPKGVRIPPGLRDIYAVVLAHFRNVSCKHPLAANVSFDYRETTVFVPCVAGLRPGLFSPILFPDNAMAITLGREIYGFPKRFGRTALDLEARYAELEVDERLEFWCRWGGEHAVEPRTYVDKFVEKTFDDACWADKVGDAAGWFFERLFVPNRRNTWPPLSVFVRKQIPDVALPCERDLVYEKDRLVRVPFDMSDVKQCHVLCDFQLCRGRKAAFLPKSEVLMAGHVNLDAGFGVRQELRDHLGSLDRLRLLQRRAARTTLRMTGRGHGLVQLGSDLFVDTARWLGNGCPSRQKEHPCKGQDQPRDCAESQPE